MNAVCKGATAVTALVLMATAAMAAGTDWETSGHNLGGDRHSPLTQINRNNVAALQIAWTYHLTPPGYMGRPRLAESVPAVNVDTGDVAWRKTLGVTDSFPPQFQDTGRPGLGGTILTASGLTFVGATDDFRFRAFATATGDKLWEVKLKASVTATPVTYLGSDKRQYVAMSDTGGSQTGSMVTNDEIIAFALPKS